MHFKKIVLFLVVAALTLGAFSARIEAADNESHDSDTALVSGPDESRKSADSTTAKDQGAQSLTSASTTRIQSSSQIKWAVTSNGGSAMTSGTKALNATLGQPAVDVIMVQSHTLRQGFWQIFTPPSCCRELTGNVDCDPGDHVDISDLSVLVDNLYVSFTPLCCKAEANVDGSVDGNIDISDLSALVDYLYVSFTPPAPCQ